MKEFKKLCENLIIFFIKFIVLVLLFFQNLPEGEKTMWKEKAKAPPRNEGQGQGQGQNGGGGGQSFVNQRGQRFQKKEQDDDEDTDWGQE